MKILYIIPGTATDQNSMIFARRQAASVEKLGHEVRVFFLVSRTSLFSLVSESFRFLRVLREFEPDIVHAQFGTVTGLFALLSRGVPRVVSFRGSDLNPAPSMGRIRSALGHLFSHIASCFTSLNICVSAEVQSRLRASARTRSIVVPNGVPLEEFRPLCSKLAREQLRWEVAAPTVIFNAGRSPRVKRQDIAEEVMRIVRTGLPDAQLQILDGMVPTEQVRLMLHAADALLVVSDFEGSPNIVKEALVCGLPIVSVDVGDVVMQTSGVEPTRIVPRECKAIANATLEILAHRERSNGYQEKSGILDDRNTADRLIAEYTRLLSCD